MAAFVAVADLRGFAPAARKLGVSASAITRGVASLEEHLGIRLLQRTTRSVTLTDAGARYLDRARRIVDDLSEADAAARAERTEPTGRFVVSAPLVFGRLHVAPVFRTMLARHPAVHGELLLADRMVNLVDEGVDVAVRIGHLEDASLVVRKVGETRRVLVASPNYLAARGKPKVPADLSEHELIQCTALSPVSEWRFEGEGPARVAFTPRFVSNSVDATIGHAAFGQGITMALSYQVETAVREGQLVVVLPKHEPPPLPIQLVYATKRHLSANVRAFADLVASSCRWQFTSTDVVRPRSRARG